MLNFALNFEFLEAEFYSAGFNGANLAANVAASAVTGVKNPPINATLPTITTSTVTNAPAAGVITDPTQLAIVQGLLNDEAHHIALLQAAITNNGGTPITEPSIDFSAGIGLMATTPQLYFAMARQFTALGNSAYSGSANYLVSNLSILQSAAQILGAEAQHLGAINYLCITLGVAPSPAGPDRQIDAQDVPPGTPENPGYPAIFTITPVGAVPYVAANPVVPPASGISRSPQQVLGVAYGVSTPTTTTPAAGTVKGGFFPAGVNGNVTST